jgi:hypothetical protein
VIVDVVTTEETHLITITVDLHGIIQGQIMKMGADLLPTDAIKVKDQITMTIATRRQAATKDTSIGRHQQTDNLVHIAIILMPGNKPMEMTDHVNTNETMEMDREILLRPTGKTMETHIDREICRQIQVDFNGKTTTIGCHHQMDTHATPIKLQPQVERQLMLHHHISVGTLRETDKVRNVVVKNVKPDRRRDLKN